MATKKKTTKKEEIITSTDNVKEENKALVEAPVEEIEPKVEEKTEKIEKKSEKTIKYPIGSIVYISRDAEADLEGFKLFPQYKKYTYTVEAYNDDTGVYTLRRLNLSLSLKEADIVAPDERAHDSLNRRQF